MVNFLIVKFIEEVDIAWKLLLTTFDCTKFVKKAIWETRTP